MVTSSGSVEIFKHQLNGSHTSKPLRAHCRLGFSSANSSVKRLPAIAAVSRCGGKESPVGSQLLVMYGTEVMPAFETLDLVSITVVNYFLVFFTAEYRTRF